MYNVSQSIDDELVNSSHNVNYANSAVQSQINVANTAAIRVIRTFTILESKLCI